MIDKKWPYCTDIGGLCFAYDISKHLGSRAFGDLIDFIITAPEGSRMTLQKNREEVSLQVLGPVQRPIKGAVDLADLQILSRKIDTTRSNSA